MKLWKWIVLGSCSAILVIMCSLSKFVWTPMPDFDINKHLDVPILDIRLDKNVKIDDVDREDYVDGRLSLKNAGTENFNGAGIEFRGRGNRSWSLYEKKGFRIKFNTPRALLGNPASRDYVLVAEGHDGTLMRNMVAFDIARNVLDGIKYQPNIQHVEVFVNGEYRGVYYLIEQIQAGENHVPITSEFDDPEPGFLVELDAYANSRGEIFNEDYIHVPGMKYPITIKSPDPDHYRKQRDEYSLFPTQLDYIREYMTNVQNAITAKDFATFETLCDVDSWVDMYILHEFMKNKYTGITSFYFYKPSGGLLHCAPAWDFDNSSGLTFARANSIGILQYAPSYKELYVQNRAELFVALLKTKDFSDLVKTRWNEVASQIKTQVKMTISKDKINSPALKRNNQRWGNEIKLEFDHIGMRTLEIGWWAYVEYGFKWAVGYPFFGQRFDYKGQIRDLNKWFNKRVSYLDEAWVAGV